MACQAYLQAAQQLTTCLGHETDESAKQLINERISATFQKVKAIEASMAVMSTPVV